MDAPWPAVARQVVSIGNLVSAAGMDTVGLREAESVAPAFQTKQAVNIEIVTFLLLAEPSVPDV